MTALLVANNGGHVKQLHSWLPRLGLGEDRVWVTVEAPQTTALLAGEEVCWVDYPDARDYRALVRHALATRHLFRQHRFSAAVSTGASLALSVLPQAAARGIDTRFIESATRFEGPSMAGRVLARMPRIRVYTQYEHLTSKRWRYGGSVFDGFTAVAGAARTRDPWRVVVTVGSTGAYGFRRLLDRMVQVLPPDAEVLWQTGSTDVTGLDIEARPAVPSDELAAAVAAADVVVAHAGTGSALGSLEAGKFPLLVPRRTAHGEHVDDHQGEIARALGQRGLALVREADEITFADLEQAATTAVERRQAPPPFTW
ncbi:glycosyltransferase [Kineococcus esterisolvens]|uniref:glycosyltransferase n=1 Tax=unclassified Kineococcus TaxID=2621656 RepID=UPI003D7DE581